MDDVHRIVPQMAESPDTHALETASPGRMWGFIYTIIRKGNLLWYSSETGSDRRLGSRVILLHQSHVDSESPRSERDHCYI